MANAINDFETSVHAAAINGGVLKTVELGDCLRWTVKLASAADLIVKARHKTDGGEDALLRQAADTAEAIARQIKSLIGE